METVEAGKRLKPDMPLTQVTRWWIHGGDASAMTWVKGIPVADSLARRSSDPTPLL